MVGMNELEKIIHAYGKVLEDLSENEDALLLISEEKLPYPKEVIHTALEAAIEITKDEQMKDHLKGGLLFLNDFTSEKEVPSNFAENLKVWANKQKSDET